MRNLKKLLSLVMALAMVASFMVMGASAAEFTDGKDIENTEAVNTLSDLGIIKGRDTGAFDPEGIVTRAEMAKMICVTMAGGKDPNMTGTGVFSDTKGHWAAGYIDYCVNMGFIAGYPDGTFQPNKTVTGTEAAKMILTILGYNAETEKFVGDVNWETNINAVASSKGIYDGAAVVPNAGLTRDDAAQMLYNGVQADMVKYELIGIINGNGVSAAVDIEDKSILSSRFDLLTTYGVLGAADAYDAKKGVYTYDFTAAAGEPALGGSIKSVADFSRFFGQDVRVLYKDNKDKTVYGVTARDSEVLAEGIVGDIDEGKATDTAFDFDGKTYKTDKKLSETNLYEVNGDLKTSKGTLAKDGLGANNLPYAFKAIDQDGNGKVDFIVITPFAVAKVTNVSKSAFSVSGNNGVSGSYDLDTDDVDVYDDIAKGDYVMVIQAANSAKNMDTFTQIDAVKGKVTSTNGKETSFTIDGETYTIANNLLSKADFGGKLNTANAGSTLTNVIAVNGYAFFAEVGESITSADYAVMIAGQSGGTGLNTVAQAQLLFADGTKKTVGIAAIQKDADSEVSVAEEIAKDENLSVATYHTLYAYETNSDGDYVLNPYTNLSKEDSGFDKIVSGSYAKATGEAGRIGGTSIADDAVIFVKDGDSFKVKTGADFRKTKAGVGGITDVTVAYADKVSATGAYSIKVAFATGKVASSDEMYGYITAAPKNVTNDKNKVVTQITFWNGTEEQTLLADTKVPGIAKHDAIKFTLDGDTMNNVVCNSVKDSKLAVVAMDGDNLTLVNGDVKDDAGNVYVLNDDTVVLYVSVEDAEGIVDEDNITLADEKIVKDEDGNVINGDFYYANVYVEATKNGDKYDVTLLIIDIANDIADAQ